MQAESSDSTPPTADRRRNHALWIGPLVALAGGISYFLVFVRYPALRDFPWVNLPWVLIGLAVSVIGVWRAYARETPYRGKLVGPISFGVSALVSVAFIFYVFGFSYWLPGPTATTLRLTDAPEFTLVDHAQRPVRLADYRGRKVVLTFYRGFW
jgi:hypothetical protein